MKKYLLGSTAIVLAVAFSAFTMSSAPVEKADKFRINPVYYQYDGSGTERDISNFPTTASTSPGTCSFAVEICWLKVSDLVNTLGQPIPDNQITSHDFYKAFDDADVDDDQLLSDETENGTAFELRSAF